MSDATRNHDPANANCSHPMNQLGPDSSEPRGSVCGVCGQRLNVRLPDEFYGAAPSPSPSTRDPHACACGAVDEASGYVWPPDHHPDGCRASPRSPSATPDPAAWEVYEDLRSRYASACERMGMAHANGTRAEWEDAAHYEVERRLALNAAVRALSRATPDRAEVERAVDRFGMKAQWWQLADDDDGEAEREYREARAALLSLFYPEDRK